MKVHPLDTTEHYPIPVLHAKKWQGTGVTLGCTHADCRWQLPRQLRQLEGETGMLAYAELFALYHVETALSGPAPRIGAEAAGFPALGDPEAMPTDADMPEVVVDIDDIVAEAEQIVDAVVVCRCPPGTSLRHRQLWFPDCPDHGANGALSR